MCETSAIMHTPTCLFPPPLLFWPGETVFASLIEAWKHELLWAHNTPPSLILPSLSAHLSSATVDVLNIAGALPDIPSSNLLVRVAALSLAALADLWPCQLPPSLSLHCKNRKMLLYSVQEAGKVSACAQTDSGCLPMKQNCCTGNGDAHRGICCTAPSSCGCGAAEKMGERGGATDTQTDPQRQQLKWKPFLKKLIL